MWISPFRYSQAWSVWHVQFALPEPQHPTMTVIPAGASGVSKAARIALGRLAFIL